MGDALVEQRHGDLHLNVEHIAVAETLDHRVAGGQLRLGVAAPAQNDDLVDQCLGDLDL